MNKVISLKGLLTIYNLPCYFTAVLTEEGKFEHVNASVATMLGYWEENLLGNPFSNIIYPDDERDDILRFSNEDGKDYIHTAINRIRRSDDSYRFFSWCFTKPAGRAFIYVVTQDFTESIEASATFL